MSTSELTPLTEWLKAAARHGYGCSGDNGKVWVLPETFSSVFGFASDPDGVTLNLYCQQSELKWLHPAGQCVVKDNHEGGCELNFWFLGKVAFVLPVPVPPDFSRVALYVYPDILADPVKIFQLSPCVDKRCCWPASVPRFHFIP